MTHHHPARRPRPGQPPPTGWSWWRRDAGSATLELAVAFPIFLALIATAVQAGLYFYARQIALAAAQHGTQTARLQGATLTDGITAARTTATVSGDGSLHQVTVTDTGSTPTQVRITVTGTAPSLLPGWHPTITQQAAGPRERFTTP